MSSIHKITSDNPVVYKIDLPTFSGPLDLLLHLIERNELDITAISLAAVTDQYLEQIHRLREERLEQLMDFLVIGAKLLVIKSRALLPQMPGELSDDEEEEDPAETLARQLKRYKRFKTAAASLRYREEHDLRTYLRVAPPPKLEQTLDMSGISLANLEEALWTALERVALKDDSVSVVVDRNFVSIDGQIRQLRQRMKETGRICFDELLSDHCTWMDVSITLLAVLELIKRQEVNVYQPELFGKIEIIAN
ncbi:MAG: segregation/condensation protein A [Chloroflexota bacterium]|jgi:segregation and condensation protein A